jgi:hypothetical protein
MWRLKCPRLPRRPEPAGARICSDRSDVPVTGTACLPCSPGLPGRPDGRGGHRPADPGPRKAPARRRAHPAAQHPAAGHRHRPRTPPGSRTGYCPQQIAVPLSLLGEGTRINADPARQPGRSHARKPVTTSYRREPGPTSDPRWPHQAGHKNGLEPKTPGQDGRVRLQGLEPRTRGLRARYSVRLFSLSCCQTILARAGSCHFVRPPVSAARCGYRMLPERTGASEQPWSNHRPGIGLDHHGLTAYSGHHHRRQRYSARHDAIRWLQPESGKGSRHGS